MIALVKAADWPAGPAHGPPAPATSDLAVAGGCYPRWPSALPATLGLGGGGGGVIKVAWGWGS
ncbi:MAG: hypothetical protein LBD90_07790, partial [Bifidobacteriaceae bacterium]|nr:hypothetical protein [Bifidobacteriaceae bacterium]